MTIKTNKYFLGFWFEVLIFAMFFTLMLSFSSCGLKKPEEDISPLKMVVSRFERGVVEQNRALLDSVYNRKVMKRDSLIRSAIEQFFTLRSSQGMEDLHFARRRFSVIEKKDSAKVELILGGKNLKEEKVLKVFLKKRWGEWKVVGQSME